ncbi:MAG: erythromycin esterase family protein [Lentisphaeria bacterium]|nr:erythromycin esterase family protein [Lentisphaeria bacterium]
MRITFLIILIALQWGCQTTPLTERQQWLKAHASPLQHLAPHQHTHDLKAVLEIIGDNRIVAMGEQTHGTREFFQFRNRVFQYLAEHHGFNYFLLEAHLDEGLLTDRILQTRVPGPKELLRRDYFNWRAMEMRQNLVWIAKYNQGKPPGKRIHYWGIDMQECYQAINILLKYLQDKEDLGARAEKLYAPYRPYGNLMQMMTYYEQSPEFKEQCRLGVMAVIQLFEDNREMLIAKSSPEAYRTMRQLTEIVRQNEHLYGTSDVLLRDFYMAKNLKWIVDNAPDDARFFLTAHNLHLIKQQIRVRMPHIGVDEPIRYMGAQVYDDHRGTICNFGFATFSGRCNALAGDRIGVHELQPNAAAHEADLAASGGGASVIDLRQLPAALDELKLFRSIGLLIPEKIYPEYPLQLKLHECWDALVVIPETTETTY